MLSTSFKNILEPIVATTGILIIGQWTLPLAAQMAGATMTRAQGLEAGVYLAVARFIGLYLLRLIFSRWK
jgi:hypothetical protein